MKSKVTNHEKDSLRKQEKIPIRRDLQDPSKGKDLSYLNEMPQMLGYEGVVAGVPPPPKEENEESKNDKVNEE